MQGPWDCLCNIQMKAADPGLVFNGHAIYPPCCNGSAELLINLSVFVMITGMVFPAKERLQGVR
jgi:hypothetical protein